MEAEQFVIDKIGNTWADYRCLKCGEVQTVDMEDNVQDVFNCPLVASTCRVPD